MLSDRKIKRLRKRVERKTERLKTEREILRRIGKIERSKQSERETRE